MKKSIRRIVAVLVCALLIASLCTSAMAATLQGGKTKARAAKLAKMSTDYVGTLKDTRGEIWYKFKTQSYDAFYTVTVKNLSVTYDIHAYLMDANEEEVARKTYFGKNNAMSANLKLKKNRWYFLRIVNQNKGKGNVKVNISVKKDAVGDTRKAAKTIARGSYVGSLDGKTDVDYLKFKAAKTGYYTFTIKNINVSSDIHDYITDKYEEELARKTYFGKNSSHEVKLKMKKGQYYFIQILSTGGTGKYKVTIR